MHLYNPYVSIKNMLLKIKNKIEKELACFLDNLDKRYSIKKISPILSDYIKDFVLRDGKRIRPTLFIMAYLGFAKKMASGLYATALSFELLHDFLLVHDDIIDKSDTRRGRSSMHKMFNNYLARYKNIKFNGQDLAIVAADVMYAIAIDAFLSIKEDATRKEKALRNFIRAAIYTGTGEFIELLYGIKNLSNISKQDIYKIYDFKTAYYTFATPLSTGAILAGVNQKQIDNLLQYGINLGRAFQIKDDILGMFSHKTKIGKSTLTDLREAKKTLLIWYAYCNSDRKNRLAIERLFSKENVGRHELLKMREIIASSGALDYAKKQIHYYLNKAYAINIPAMRPQYKNLLDNYSQKLLNL